MSARAMLLYREYPGYLGCWYAVWQWWQSGTNTTIKSPIILRYNWKLVTYNDPCIQPLQTNLLKTIKNSKVFANDFRFALLCVCVCVCIHFHPFKRARTKKIFFFHNFFFDFYVCVPSVSFFPRSLSFARISCVFIYCHVFFWLCDS